MTVTELLARADAILAAPPRYDHIVRVPGRGELLARAVVPLVLLPTTNRTRGKSNVGAITGEKNRLFSAMRAQLTPRSEPLPGRPHVRCVRFSATEPDAYNDGFKRAVDMLCTPKGRAKTRRLGWLVDDAPRYALVTQWWEYAPAGAGFGLIEIWDGEEKR